MENLIDISTATVTHVSEIVELTKPLRILGITFFCYTKINFIANYCVSLLNHGEFGEFYLANECYKVDPFASNPKAYFPGIYLWNSIFHTERQQKFLKSNNAFGIYHGCTYVKSTENNVEFFHFGAEKKNRNIINTYVNKFNLLATFANFFTDSISIFKNEIPKFYLPNYNTKDDKVMVCDAPVSINKKQEVLFLEKVNYRKYQFSNLSPQRLSPREIQCIELSIQGLTAKEIARVLNLSPRTVEFYFNNLKEKACCRNKSELIAKALEIQHL